MVRAAFLLFALLRLTSAKEHLRPAPRVVELNGSHFDLQDRGLVTDVVNTATSVTAQLQVGMCVRLKTAFDFTAQNLGDDSAASIRLKAGACLCVDANVYAGVLDASTGVEVVAQVQGQQSINFKGDLARTIARSIQLPVLYPGARARFNFKLDPATVCLSASAMLGFSEHKFHPPGQGTCCERKCIDGYIERNGQCVPGCPEGQVRRPNGKCKPDCTANQIECDGACYPKNQYTCPSGIPVPKTKRSLATKQCGHGLTLCPVPYGQGWECLDTRNNIESCGGCISNAKLSEAGVDCTALQNTNSVSCLRGSCRVHSCQRGFLPTVNGTACEPSRGRKPFHIQAGHSK